MRKTKTAGARLGLLSTVAALLLLPGCTRPMPAPEDTSIPSFGDGAKAAVFRVMVPAWTPQGDQVYLYVDEIYHPPDGGFPMTRSGPHEWVVRIRTHAEHEELHYRYNRNNFGYPTHERFEPDRPGAHRTIDLSKGGAQDVVSDWRWLPREPPQGLVHDVPSLADRETPFTVGVSLYDFFQPRFKPFVNSTLERLADVGFTYVEVPVPARVFSSVEPFQYVEPTFNDMSLPQLEAIVAKAETVGLRVVVASGFNMWLDDGTKVAAMEAALRAPHDDAWYEQLARDWELAMVERAEWADAHGVGTLILSNQWPFFGRPTPEQVPRLNAWIRNALTNVSLAYDGNLTMDLYDFTDGYDYYSALDWIGDKWTAPLATTNETTVEAMKQAAREFLAARYGPIHEKYGKPIVFPQVSYATHDGAAGGYFLPPEAGPTWEQVPDDPRYPFDFQEQADAYHATLSAMAEKPWVLAAFHFSDGYWDQVDKAQGIRGKPSEDVWATWAAAYPE